jgi:hypothetical protein
MRRISLFLSAFGLLLAAAAPAAAQDRTGSWEISPFVGGYFGGRLYDDNAFYVASSGPGPGSTIHFSPIDASNDLLYGSRIGYNVNRWFGIEVDWSHSRPDLKTRLTPFSGSRTKVGRLTQDSFEVNALFNFGRRKVIGYFGLGSGAAVLKTDLTGISSTTSTRYTGSLSLGGKFFFTPHVGIRIDGRYRYTDLDHNTRNGTTCDRDGFCTNNRTNLYSNGELTSGLTFAF